MSRPAYLGRCLFAALTVWLAAFAASWPSSHHLLPWLPATLATGVAVLTAPVAVGRYGGSARLAAHSVLRWQAFGLVLGLYLPGPVAFAIANLIGLPWSLLRAHPSDYPTGQQLVLRLCYGFGADATLFFALLSLILGSSPQNCAVNGIGWGVAVVGLTVLFTGGCSGCLIAFAVWFVTMVALGHRVESSLGLLVGHVGVWAMAQRAGIQPTESEPHSNVE